MYANRRLPAQFTTLKTERGILQVVQAIDRIIGLDWVKPATIRVTFLSGMVREVQLRRHARKGTVLERLSDTDFIARGRIADQGYVLRWPGGVEFSSWYLSRVGKLVRPPQAGAEKPPAELQQRAASGR